MEWTTVKNPSSVQPFGSGPQDGPDFRNESVTDFPSKRLHLQEATWKNCEPIVKLLVEKGR